MTSGAWARFPIGAYLRAIGQLRADAETARSIAGMLGLRVAEAEPPLPPSELPLRPPVELPRRPPIEAPRVDVGREVTRPSTPTVGPGEFKVVRVTGRVAPTVQVMPQLAQPRPFKLVELPFEPLLRRVATRSIIHAAVAVNRGGAVLDVRRAIDRIARKRPLLPPPWLLHPTTPGSVRILVDEGPGMTQFARDAEDLADRIAAVAGRGRTERVRMWQTPYAADDLLEHRRLPGALNGTVIAITDLGIAPAEVRARSIADAWLHLAGELRASGTRLVVFVPYPSARWPRRLGSLQVVTWDRTTSLAEVRRVLRRARSVAS